MLLLKLVSPDLQEEVNMMWFGLYYLFSSNVTFIAKIIQEAFISSLIIQILNLGMIRVFELNSYAFLYFISLSNEEFSFLLYNLLRVLEIFILFQAFTAFI